MEHGNTNKRAGAPVLDPFWFYFCNQRYNTGRVLVILVFSLV